MEDVEVNVRIWKWTLKKRNGKFLSDLFDFGQVPVSGSYEHGNEILGEEFLDKMSN